MSQPKVAALAHAGALAPPAAAVALACGLIALAASVDRGGGTATLPIAAGTFALMLAALLRPIEPAPGTKVTLAGAVSIFAACTLPGAQAVGAALLAALAAKLVQRASAPNLAVNVAKAAGAAGAASLAVTALGLSIPGLVLAGTAHVVVTLVAVALMVVAAQGTRAAGAFVAREWLPTAALVSSGLVAALLWSMAPLAIVLLLPPLAVIELAARANARAARTARELAAALESQRTFASDAAHELRTPLTALRGNLDYLVPAALRLDERAALTDAQRDVTRLLALIERLLMFARVPGGHDAGLQADLAECVRETVGSIRPPAGLAVVADLRGAVGVAMPPELLRTVVGDLVANAVAYTPAGKVTVSAAARGSRAVLTVHDTGIGMADDERLRAFDRFFRGARARQLADGTGLGLPIVRRIVDAYGGDLTLASEADLGTTVTVELPAAR